VGERCSGWNNHNVTKTATAARVILFDDLIGSNEQRRRDFEVLHAPLKYRLREFIAGVIASRKTTNSNKKGMDG
jgi:hypothetical protein